MTSRKYKVIAFTRTQGCVFGSKNAGQSWFMLTGKLAMGDATSLCAQLANLGDSVTNARITARSLLAQKGITF